MEDDLKHLKTRFADNAHLISSAPPTKDEQVLTDDENKFVLAVFGSKSLNNINQFIQKKRQFNRFMFNALNLAMARKLVTSEEGKQFLTEAPTIQQIEDLITEEIEQSGLQDEFKQFKIFRTDRKNKKDDRKYHTIVPTFLTAGPWAFFQPATYTISSRLPRDPELKGHFRRSERFDNKPMKLDSGFEIGKIDTIEFLNKLIIPHGIQKTLLLLEIDSDPETTGGADRLWYRTKQQLWGISYDDVVNYVRNSEPHQIHRQVSKTITSRPILLKAPGIMGSVDLVDLRKHVSSQDPFNWVLTYVDLFSKWTAARPIREKSGPLAAAAMFDILCSIPEHLRPTIIQSDNGKEFTSNAFRQALGMFKKHAVKKRIEKLKRNQPIDQVKLKEFEAQLEQLEAVEECSDDPKITYEMRLASDPENIEEIGGIRHIFSTSYNPNAQASIERFNRTLKSMIYKFSTRERVGPQREDEEFKNLSWVSKLPLFLKNHNSAPNDTTKLTPDEVMEAKADDPIFTQVFEKLRHNAMKTIARSHKPLQTYAKSLAWMNEKQDKLQQIADKKPAQKRKTMDDMEANMSTQYYYHRKKIREYEETEIQKGDVVRLAVVTDKEVRKNIFRKGALGYWSRSLYVVVSQQWLAKGTPVDKDEAKQLGLEKTYRVRKLNIDFDEVHESRQHQPGYDVLTGLANTYGIVIGAIPTKDELLKLATSEKKGQKRPVDAKKSVNQQEQDKAEDAEEEADKDDEDILMPTEKHLFWRFQLQKVDPERLIVDQRGAKYYGPERPEPDPLPPLTTSELFDEANRIFSKRDLTEAALDANRWMEKFERRENPDQKDEKLDETKQEIEAIIQVAKLHRDDTLRFRGRNLPAALAQDQFLQFVDKLRRQPEVDQPEVDEQPRQRRRPGQRTSGRRRFENSQFRDS
jgi:hypothetical protein